MRPRLTEIIPDPNQPRRQFDEASLATLAASMEALGQIHPIVVRYLEALDKHAIVDGHRRYLAAQSLGWKDIDAILAQHVDDATTLAAQVASNEAREELTAAELARAVHSYMDRTGASASEAARVMGLSKSKVTFLLSFFAVDPLVQDWVSQGLITQMGLYYLARTSGETQMELARAIAEGRMTVEECKQKVHSVVGKQARAAKAKVTLKLAGVTVSAATFDELKKAVRKVQAAMKKAQSLDALSRLINPQDDDPESPAPVPA